MSESTPAADPKPLAAVPCTIEEWQDARRLFGLARTWAVQHPDSNGYIIIGPDAPLGIGYFSRVEDGRARPSTWRECCPRAWAAHYGAKPVQRRI
jgi:hypothetical protein